LVIGFFFWQGAFAGAPAETGKNAASTRMTYGRFLEYLDADRVTNVDLYDGGRTAIIEANDQDIENRTQRWRVDLPVNAPELIQKLREKQVSFDAHPMRNDGAIWGLLGNLVFPVLLITGLFFLFRRSNNLPGGPGQAMNFGKSRARFQMEAKTGVKFDDVAGIEEAKEELQEVVTFLKQPEKFTAVGARIPKGVLLVGPPGTGKTLLAKAIAGEAGVPFFSISGSEFVEMFVGVGASRVRDLFKKAKDNAPCIIFIDEIDAVGRQRGAGIGGGNDEREQTLNQLLTEMDGFEGNTGIIIIAATNRPDVLDAALLRPGRFDRQVVVDRPDYAGRKEILNVHSRGKTLAQDVDLDKIARRTPGFTGADLANLLNEAAILAARRNLTEISMDEINDAIDRVLAGPEKKNRVMSEKRKTLVAYHEAGHAVVSWMLKYIDPLLKVSIVPRGKSLGAAWYLPEEKNIRSASAFHEQLCAALAGRAAEEIIFGEVSSGALDDLEKVTKQAYSMVLYFGFSSKIGNISFYDSTGQTENALVKPFSEETGKIIDDEVRMLISSNYEKTKSLLIEKKSLLIEVAEQLLKSEILYKEDLEKILGKRSPIRSYPIIQS
jgi:cell division protease FtsH